jgi:hypothetical protein
VVAEAAVIISMLLLVQPEPLMKVLLVEMATAQQGKEALVVAEAQEHLAALFPQ